MNDRFLEDLKNRIDIVEIAKRYAPDLKKSGKNYMCRSPFRNERTPSFCVSPDKQFWYDFGVAEGGDVISFVERAENLSFPEAIEMLADMAGLEIPKQFGTQKGPSKEEKKDIFALHKKASEFFANQLQNSEKAQNYLKDRGISAKAIREWKLGYGGEKPDGLTKFLLEEGFSESDITRSGVAFEREFGDKKMRDRFFERLIIPIFDHRDSKKIIAFTGRDLSGRENVAKYVNSPENPVYHKSSTLFGFDRARNIIREKDAVILVEGNFDVISAHSAGFLHTVATCGTSLTDDHLRLLKRLTKNMYVAFDSDVAGKRATLRAVEMILRLELNPFIIDLEDVKDLDDLAQQGPEKLKKVIANAKNALFFLFQKFSEKYLDETIEGEKKFLDAIFFFLSLVSRPVERDELLSKISKKINRPKSIVEEEFQKFSAQKKNPRLPREKKTDTKSQKPEREACFVGFLSAYWNFFEEKVTDKVLGSLTGVPREILEKKIIGEELSEEERKTLYAWELYQENLYGEGVGSEILQRDFETFLIQLQKQKQNQDRLEQARRIRQNFSS